MDVSSDQVRVIVGVAGAVMLLVGWFSSDSGVARYQHRERWSRRKSTLSDLGFDTSGTTYEGRDPSARESLMGGFGRLKLLFFGAVCVGVAIFWKKIGAWLMSSGVLG